MYKTWVEGKCGSDKAHIDPCSCTFHGKTQCANRRITYIEVGWGDGLPAGSSKGWVALLDLTGLTYLGLGDSHLTGTIPSALMQLTGLSWLSFSGSNLTGTIPSSLAQLTGLTMLNICGNQLTGTIPSALARLTGLNSLVLSDNQLTGTIPPVFTQLTDLSGLGLNDNQLTGTVPDLFAHISADFCDISGNHFKCPLPAGAVDKCGASCT